MSGFLDKVYEVSGEDDTRALYDAWSDSYEAEIAQNGYATPDRCADALAQVTGDMSVDILDFGCGTGLSGQAFAKRGFLNIDGVDLSAEMLAKAGSKGVYRHLAQINAEHPLDKARYDAVAAVGVIGVGAAPITVFPTLLDALKPCGHLVFSFNDHTLAEPVYWEAVDHAISAGHAKIVFQEHGAHLPKLDMQSTVYVLEKT